ncbi:hypothetical protein QAD02_007417 [Eretmocerus hayati]|uniref:Uncharacterized protein n=1 Tax=Eretmocerus hayati TaxID=131215 RepID=A0ACC2N3J8_9HYME|nr:hypothetical protein QAD02_007417 [Eretmocerus hayati]
MQSRTEVILEVMPKDDCVFVEDQRGYQDVEEKNRITRDDNIQPKTGDKGTDEELKEEKARRRGREGKEKRDDETTTTMKMRINEGIRRKKSTCKWMQVEWENKWENTK